MRTREREARQKLAAMAQTCNPITAEIDARKPLIQGHLGLQSETLFLAKGKHKYVTVRDH